MAAARHTRQRSIHGLAHIYTYVQHNQLAKSCTLRSGGDVHKMEIKICASGFTVGAEDSLHDSEIAAMYPKKCSFTVKFSF